MRKLLTPVLLLFLGSQAIANPIVINYSHDFLWYTSVYQDTPLWIPIVSSILAVALEFIALRFLVQIGEPKIDNLRKKFLIINSVTFPLTQIAAFWFGPASELIPIIVEKLFYNRDTKFKEWGHKGWLAVIGVNLFSYAVGILFSELYLRVAYS